jgi:hypothetical protein
MPIKTIGDLYKACKSDDAMRLQSCLSYLQGAYDLMQSIGWVHDRDDVPKTKVWDAFAACGSPTPEQLRQAFIARADMNRHWSEPAAICAWEGINDHWTCPGTSIPSVPIPQPPQ